VVCPCPLGLPGNSVLTHPPATDQSHGA
jgi:hypothetical protein